jgi:hypothetical protein
MMAVKQPTPPPDREAKQKAAFVLLLLQKNPDLTWRDLNFAVHSKFKSGMNAGKIQRLKKDFRDGNNTDLIRIATLETEITDLKIGIKQLLALFMAANGELKSGSPIDKAAFIRLVKEHTKNENITQLMESVKDV